MVTGRIKLGAIKELSGKPLSCDLPEGFFYWWRRKPEFSAVIAGCRYHTVEKQTAESKTTKSNVLNPARQAPNFSDNLCMGIAVRGRQKVVLTQVQGNLTLCKNQTKVRLTSQVLESDQQILPIPTHFFYDIPSRKRVARCTNIFHTGALPTVKGGRQRLSWGFQRQQKRGSLTYGSNPFQFESWEWPSDRFKLSPHWLRRSRPTACFESLNSVVEIRHPARNTRLWDTDLCLTCIYRT